MTALVLGARRHGESALILELMTRAHGRHLGLVHGGRSKRLQPVLQPGNTVHAVWRARLDEHLGTFAVEGGEMRAARFIALAARALRGRARWRRCCASLPERDPHPALYDAAPCSSTISTTRHIAPALFVRFELALLAELGFGLDLSRLRRDREPRRPRLRLAEERPRGQRARRARPIGTGSSPAGLPHGRDRANRPGPAESRPVSR